MRASTQCVCLAALAMLGAAESGFAQNPLTWAEVRERFEKTNPALRAGQIGVEEFRAAELSARLRPNPNLSLTLDQINPFPGGAPHRTFGSLLTVGSASYLYERDHKRELREESAQRATGIASAGQADLERNLIFALRLSFLQALQEKAILAMAEQNLTYYDQVLGVNRERFKAGALSRVDLDRLELQRVQYESDRQIARQDLQTAKILLLMLLNDRTRADPFDVTGPFEFSSQLPPLDELHQQALDARPDLRAALGMIDKARTDHRLAIANGSTDPTIAFDAGRNPPIDSYLGFSVSIPLRIFDRNQGEKLRTRLDIERNEKLSEAARAQVFSDVDAAYAALAGTLVLLEPYKNRYLAQALRVRDTMAFSYEHGAASLLDFLSAQSDYRILQVSYLHLIGSYLNAANQLNLAAGREVIP